MPKSKNRRKKGKKPPRRPKKQQPAVTDSRMNPRPSFKEMFRVDHPDAWFRAVMFSPFFVGSWIAGGFLLQEYLTITCTVVLVMAATYFGQVAKSAAAIRSEAKEHKAISLLIIALLVAQFFVLQNYIANLLVLAVVVAYVTTGDLVFDSTRQLLKACVALIGGMFALTVLGAYIQLQEFYPATWWVGLIGAISGSLLGATLVLRHREVCQAAGWRFHRFVTDKKTGEEIRRPAKALQAVSILSIVIPSTPVILSGVQFLPISFLLYTIVVLPTTSMAGQLLKEDSYAPVAA